MMTETALKALNKLMALCSKTEKCELDAFTYMTSHGCSDEEAALGVEYLVENKYVDNRRYAESFFFRQTEVFEMGQKKNCQPSQAQKNLP
ncbi:MAG: hypothetical protein IIT56_04680 [Bacteroidales bacterium]|nr:hypothetical protein [Bacteroidales bacterium]